jgi:hypothetical protein
MEKNADEVTGWHATAAAALGLLAWLSGNVVAGIIPGLLRHDPAAPWTRPQLAGLAFALALCAAAIAAFCWAAPRLWREIIARDRTVRVVLLLALPLAIVLMAARPYFVALGGALSGRGAIPVAGREALLTAPFLGTGACVGMACLGIVLAWFVQRFVRRRAG